jgi:hypothetical protein
MPLLAFSASERGVASPTMKSGMSSTQT